VDATGVADAGIQREPHMGDDMDDRDRDRELGMRLREIAEDAKGIRVGDDGDGQPAFDMLRRMRSLPELREAIDAYVRLEVEIRRAERRLDERVEGFWKKQVE
jgi:hypothetical protein